MSGSSRDSQRHRQPTSPPNPPSGGQPTTQRQAQAESSGARPVRRITQSPGPPPNRPLPPLPRPNTPTPSPHETTQSQQQPSMPAASDVPSSSTSPSAPRRRKGSINLRSLAEALAADVPEIPPIPIEQSSPRRSESSTSVKLEASDVPSSSTEQPTLRRRKSSLKLSESASSSRPRTPQTVNPSTTLSTEASENSEIVEKLKPGWVVFPRRHMDPNLKLNVEADKIITVEGIQLLVKNMHHIRHWDPSLHQHLYRMNPDDIIPLRRFDPQGVMFLCRWVGDAWEENNLEMSINMAKIKVDKIFYAAIFAEKFRCPRFWNATIKAIFAIVKTITRAKKIVLPLKDLVRIDERTVTDSPIRHMVYASVVFRPDFETWEDVVKAFDQHWRRSNEFWGSKIYWTKDHATAEFKKNIVEGLARKQKNGAEEDPFKMDSKYLPSEYLYCDAFEEEEFPDPLAPALDKNPRRIRNTECLPRYAQDGTMTFRTNEHGPEDGGEEWQSLP